MIETHPFKPFVPDVCHYLFLGTFTGKITDTSYDWYFGTKRNQFWPMLEEVFGIELRNKEIKQKLFSKLEMAITDVIWQCERSVGTNADNNLINIVYNTEVITKIFNENEIRSVYFSSRMAEKIFKKNFKELIQQYSNTELITLPSPSPRFARMTKVEKIKKYRELLPRI